MQYTISPESFSDGLERLRNCVIPPESRAECDALLGIDNLVRCSMEELANITSRLVKIAFGENPPQFVQGFINDAEICMSRMRTILEYEEILESNPALKELKGVIELIYPESITAEPLAKEDIQIEEDAELLVNQLLLTRFAIAAKLFVLFGFKILKDLAWDKFEAANFNGARTTIAEIGYINNVWQQSLEQMPTREELGDESGEIHQKGWQLANLHDPSIPQNCVVSAWTIMTGISQATGWDRIFFTQMTKNAEGEPAKHITPLITHPNIVRWSLIDTYYSSFMTPGGLYYCLNQSELDRVVDNPCGTIARCSVDRDLAVVCLLPSEALVTDPLTGFSVVNLHHAGQPVGEEPFDETHAILQSTAQAISNQLFAEW